DGSIPDKSLQIALQNIARTLVNYEIFNLLNDNRCIATCPRAGSCDAGCLRPNVRSQSARVPFSNIATHSLRVSRDSDRTKCRKPNESFLPGKYPRSLQDLACAAQMA